MDHNSIDKSALEKALSDGILLDVTELARNAGMDCNAYMSAELFDHEALLSCFTRLQGIFHDAMLLRMDIESNFKGTKRYPITPNNSSWGVYGVLFLIKHVYSDSDEPTLLIDDPDGDVIKLLELASLNIADCHVV